MWYFPFVSCFTFVESLFEGSKSLWSKYFANGWKKTVKNDHFEQNVILIIFSNISFWSFWSRCNFDHFEQISVLIIVSKFSFAKWSPNPQCCSSHRFGGKAGIILHIIAVTYALQRIYTTCSFSCSFFALQGESYVHLRNLLFYLLLKMCPIILL